MSEAYMKNVSDEVREIIRNNKDEVLKSILSKTEYSDNEPLQWNTVSTIKDKLYSDDYSKFILGNSKNIETCSWLWEAKPKETHWYYQAIYSYLNDVEEVLGVVISNLTKRYYHSDALLERVYSEYLLEDDLS